MNNTFSNLADRIAFALQGENNSIRDYMISTNQIHQSMCNSELKPFADVDVAFAGFVDMLRNEATQRERDLVYISENFYKAYAYLHQDVQLFKKQLNEHQLSTVHNVYNALKSIDKQTLLTDGLTKKTLKLLKWVSI